MISNPFGSPVTLTILTAPTALWRDKSMSTQHDTTSAPTVNATINFLRQAKTNCSTGQIEGVLLCFIAIHGILQLRFMEEIPKHLTLQGIILDYSKLIYVLQCLEGAQLHQPAEQHIMAALQIDTKDTGMIATYADQTCASVRGGTTTLASQLGSDPEYLHFNNEPEPLKLAA